MRERLLPFPPHPFLFGGDLPAHRGEDVACPSPAVPFSSCSFSSAFLVCLPMSVVDSVPSAHVQGTHPQLGASDPAVGLLATWNSECVCRSLLTDGVPWASKPACRWRSPHPALRVQAKTLHGVPHEAGRGGALHSPACSGVWGCLRIACLWTAPPPSFGSSSPTPRPAKLHIFCHPAFRFHSVEVPSFPFLSFCFVFLLFKPHYCYFRRVLAFGKGFVLWATSSSWGQPPVPTTATCLGDRPPRLPPFPRGGLGAREQPFPAGPPSIRLFLRAVSVRGRGVSGKSSVIAVGWRRQSLGGGSELHLHISV